MEHKLAVRHVYEEPFKRKVVEEYLKTSCSARGLLRKYNIRQKDAIQTWVKQLGYTDIAGSFTRSKNFILNRKEPLKQLADKNDNAELSKRIKELEQRLEDEQLLREIYEKMIKVAEERFKIDIRKKRNTR